MLLNDRMTKPVGVPPEQNTTEMEDVMESGHMMKLMPGIGTAGLQGAIVNNSRTP